MHIYVCIVAVFKVCHMSLKLLFVVAHQKLETASLKAAEKGREWYGFRNMRLLKPEGGSSYNLYQIVPKYIFRCIMWEEGGCYQISSKLNLAACNYLIQVDCGNS